MTALLGAADIRELARALEIAPTKKLGQNFVIDANTVRRIVRLAGVTPRDTVLEIGPGLGSLTLGLLETGCQVIAVEIDARLAAALPETVRARAGGAADALTVLHQDALRVESLPRQPGLLVANLPYNVSVPVLLHLLPLLPSLRGGVVMVQAEVGARLAAAPGSKVYGAPSVKAAWYGTWRAAGAVPRAVFWPTPNVDSVLVAFARHPSPSGDGRERDRVFALVDAAFGQRRKMLRRALADLLGDSSAASAALAAAGVDPTARGEQLALPDFLALARSLDHPSGGASRLG